ncbi:MED6 mediator sub complex component-domain-containing protein [Schizothecium vesticola]|uniref:Mediator of RNA polymerase II transcription subunit 6 n=1 Tax=Schizothecium vesticola TaxID=314040 RepID=A0AA40KAM3_9PEZI|nr:MED6 mediator sub complex component-domain-containing protein [Schizothecium vesticola]
MADPPPFEGGVHNNSVLYYFALSPFYDKTSNNEVLFQQGLNNANMTQYLATRELFEGRLKTMSGLEFVVAQEPAETGPNAGTGIWVINKQNRRKRQGEDDEVTVLGTYFISGENIYMAPSLADILNSRVASIACSIAKIPSTANKLQNFSSATGRTYLKPKPKDDATPAPAPAAATATADDELNALVGESFRIHERYGHEYLDLNPITGKPGDFHLSSTGRKEKPAVAVAKSAVALAPATTTMTTTTLPPLDVKVESPLAKTGKSPRVGSMPKLKRRKSKGGATPS